MSARKSERLLNLLILLLVARRPASKEHIRATLYTQESEDAFERKFDRDKEELRSLGVPIEVVQLDPFFDDAVGYQIRPEKFALPEISLDADEASVLGLAGRVWEHATLSSATSQALTKLRAAGLEPDPGALDEVGARINADEPAFDDFLDAALQRTPVAFDYRTGSGQLSERHLQPWGVVRYSGRWYVGGWDSDRGDERVFRMSRVQGEVRDTGEPGAFEPQDRERLRDMAARLAPPRPQGHSQLLVRAGAGARLRREGTVLDQNVPGPDSATTWDRLEVPRAGTALVDEVLALSDHVVVEEPAGVRDEVERRLAALVDLLEGGLA